MSSKLVLRIILPTVALLAAAAPAAAEMLYDQYGRPVMDDGAPPPRRYAPPPVYDDPGYAPRTSRYQQGRVCSTPYGTCELPGPMFVGKGCKCNFPGYGKVGGRAAP
jgi:hypothetical protein